MGGVKGSVSVRRGFPQMINFFEWGDATTRMARDVALSTLVVRALLMLSSVGVLMLGVEWI